MSCILETLSIRYVFLLKRVKNSPKMTENALKVEKFEMKTFLKIKLLMSWFKKMFKAKEEIF